MWSEALTKVSGDRPRGEAVRDSCGTNAVGIDVEGRRPPWCSSRGGLVIHVWMRIVGGEPAGIRTQDPRISRCRFRHDPCTRRRLGEYGQPPLRIDASPWAIGRSPSLPSRRWLTHGVGNRSSYPASRELYGLPDRRIDVPPIDLRGDIGADPRLPRDVPPNPMEARSRDHAPVEVPSAVEDGPSGETTAC